MLNDLARLMPPPTVIAASLQGFAELVTLLGAAGTVLFMIVFLDHLNDSERKSCRRALRVFILLGLVSIMAKFAMTYDFTTQNPANPRIMRFLAALRSPESNLFWIKSLGLLLAGLARRSSLAAFCFATVGAMILLLTLAMGTHTGAPGRPIEWIALTLVHVMVAAFWFGSYVPLKAVTRRRDPRDAEFVLRRWSRLMRWFVFLILATGLVQALAVTGSLAALYRTTYGQILIVKVLLVGAILAAAMFSRTRHMVYMAGGDMIAATGMRRAISHEFWVALVVLGLSSWLVHVPLGR